jgi:predicted RNA-binding protein Jag
MDFIEVEGKTYEEAIKKASQALNVDEKDLDIDVKEVDTKGILGLLGSKKVRITARIKGIHQPLKQKIHMRNMEKNSLQSWQL